MATTAVAIPSIEDRLLRRQYRGGSRPGGSGGSPAAHRTVVSRGGRSDLAGSALRKVLAPTLLIIGGEDTAVIHMNRHAIEQLRCEKRLEIVPGATHLFEEPGALEQVARLALEWFELHLGRLLDEIPVA
jgi:putative phosphoribosyl transferase